MNKLFKQIRVGKVRRNAFDLSHEKKLSMNSGSLIPVLCTEILPNENWRVSTEQIVRMAPMVAPVMHRVNVYMHYFFVPNRLIWDNWQSFITGGVAGDDTHTTPKFKIDQNTYTNFGIGSLADYMGIRPTDETAVHNATIQVLPFRAYQQIYNDYYVDQTLQVPVEIEKGDTQVSDAIFELRNRGWEKDYFTSSLPFTQRSEDVSIPYDITYKDPAYAYKYGTTGADGPISAVGPTGFLTDPSEGVRIENIQDFTANVNDLRTAVRLQEWLEKNARAGSRYIEQILAHFGIRTPDYRLQRAEYLGGGKVPIQISEVLANFGSATLPQGNMAGHGLGVGNAPGFKAKFSEHGWLFGIMSIMPKSCYSNSTHRMFMKNTKFDFAFPEFGHLGEEPVYLSELWDTHDDATRSETFGYQSRYAHYKYIPDTVHGDFHFTLNHWHWGRSFATKPVLNEDFIKYVQDDRIFAVDDLAATDKFYVQLYNRISAIRPLPVFGTPML